MNCVLITGATGVIGSELVPLFLASEAFQIRLLIRASSPAHLEERLEELFRYWQLDPGGSACRGRIEAIAGDVSAKQLGLDEVTYRRLAGEVTHIVHAAGCVKLNQSIEDARRNALEPARQLVALARACQRSGQFQKFDAVTTIGVAGRMPGLIPERRLTEPREFHNNYERAKAETEDYLFGELEAGLPLTIHRPSMVIARSDNGRVWRKQVFYYLSQFLTGEKTWGILPDFGDATLDLIPVDHVARAIYLASTDPATIGRVFHLCAGPERAVRLAELVARLRQEAIAQGKQLPQLKPLPLAWFARLLPLVAALTWGRTRKALNGLPYFLGYLEERQAFGVAGTTLAVDIATQQSDAF